tara:strand:+ start:429 stop:779 length:351 start_codon:yes stop_codon:yes gene_type:complete
MGERSILERRFILYWDGLDGPELCEELKFHPTRKWRFDFAHEQTQVAIEIEGGVWNQSRHTKPAGFIKDCEKYNAATALGWRIFRLPGYLITLPNLQQIKDFIECQTTTPNSAPAH